MGGFIMANVLFKRIEDSSLIDNYPIVDGSYYVTKDGKSYVDYDNQRVPIGGTPDDTMSDRSTNAVQNKVVKEYVDDVKEDLSVFQYDLITNGPEVKTGRKIDGKDVYAKRFYFQNIDNLTTIYHGLTNFEIVGRDCVENNNNVFHFPDFSTSGYFTIDVSATQITIYQNLGITGTMTITLYYIYND